MLVLPWTIVTEFTAALASTFTTECYRKVLGGNLLEKLGFVPSTQNVDFVNLEKNVSSKRHLRIITMVGPFTVTGSKNFFTTLKTPEKPQGALMMYSFPSLSG